MSQPAVVVPAPPGVARVEKPWGYELIWARTERYVGKLLHIRAGERLSLQFHRVKDETIHVQRGELRFVVEEAGALVERLLLPGDSYHIVPQTRHRMIAVTDCDVLEASTPELDDVVRLEDSYGRAG
jgi:quercetin dioxygenase-like cupin family protein